MTAIKSPLMNDQKFEQLLSEGDIALKMNYSTVHKF